MSMNPIRKFFTQIFVMQTQLEIPFVMKCHNSHILDTLKASTSATCDRSMVSVCFQNFKMLKIFSIFVIMLTDFTIHSEVVNDDKRSLSNNLLIQRAINQVKAGGEPAKCTVSRIKKSLHEIVKRHTVHISTECYNDLILFMDTLNESPEKGQSYNWAQQMMDSYGGVASGIAQVNMYWLGDFWECLNVRVKHSNSSELRFKGQYCLASIKAFVPLPIKIGTCFPSTCTYLELENVVNSTLSFPFAISLHPQFCQTDDKKPWDATTLIINVFFGFLISLVIIGTLYDIIMTKFKTKADGTSLQQFNAEKFSQMLLAFSATKNFERIFSISHIDQGFAAVHGLRAISISWIVIGHSMLIMYSFIPFKNMAVIMDAAKKYQIQPILSTEFGVDTFFCISGFLAAYGMMEHFANKRRFNYPTYALHRIFRLSPAYFVLLAFMCGPYAHTGQSPVFAAVGADQRVCRERWWQNILYINIYFDHTEKCLPQAWYLCLDIVYYIVLYPLIMIPIIKKPILGKINFVIIFMTSFIIPAALIYHYNLAAYPSSNVTQEQRDKFMTYVYNKPWGRISTVLIGMAFGYLMHIKGKAVKINLVLVWILWLSSAAIDLALVYGMQPYMDGKTMDQNMQMAFGTFSRPAWGFTIGWIIYSCTTGYGGLINKILSWKAFIPISRLSYTIYLVHFTVIGIYYASRPEGTYIDLGIVAYICASMIIISIVCALALSLITEAPFINLEKILFKMSATTTNKNDQIKDRHTPLIPKSD